MPPPASHPSLGPIAPLNSSTGDGSDLARWFAAEVQPHDASLKAYLRRAFPAVRDLDDVVQESYLRIWRARLSGSVDSARGFLFCVARHLAVDFIRSNQRSPLVALGDSADLDVIADGPDAFEQTAAEEKTAILAAALEGLPRRQREIVILCKLQSKSHREVSVALGLSEKTVTEHVYRGVQRLGVELQRRGIHRLNA